MKWYYRQLSDKKGEWYYLKNTSEQSVWQRQAVSGAQSTRLYYVATALLAILLMGCAHGFPLFARLWRSGAADTSQHLYERYHQDNWGNSGCTCRWARGTGRIKAGYCCSDKMAYQVSVYRSPGDLPRWILSQFFFFILKRQTFSIAQSLSLQNIISMYPE